MPHVFFLRMTMITEETMLSKCIHQPDCVLTRIDGSRISILLITDCVSSQEKNLGTKLGYDLQGTQLSEESAWWFSRKIVTKTLRCWLDRFWGAEPNAQRVENLEISIWKNFGYEVMVHTL